MPPANVSATTTKAEGAIDVAGFPIAPMNWGTIAHGKPPAPHPVWLNTSPQHQHRECETRAAASTRGRSIAATIAQLRWADNAQ